MFGLNSAKCDENRKHNTEMTSQSYLYLVPGCNKVLCMTIHTALCLLFKSSMFSATMVQYCRICWYYCQLFLQ